MDSVPETVVTFSVLLLVFTATKHYTRRSALPPEAWILILGIAYGLTKSHGDFASWPDLELHPNAILFLFLPLLIFASGRHISPTGLRQNWLPIILYAGPGIMCSAFLIGAPVAWILDIALIHGLLIGVAIGATDPVAVGAIFSKFSMPRRLDLIVEGESLFNDGTTVVLFVLVSGIAINGLAFNLPSALGDFIWSVVGAIPIGWMGGWIATRILKTWQEVEVFFIASMGIISALLVFYIAEHVVHVSGVIAVLTTALVFVHYQRRQAEQDKDQLRMPVMNAFWDYMSQVLNSMMFFMLGVATGLHEFNLPLEALLIGGVAMIAARVLVVYGGGLLLAPTNSKLSFAWQHVLVLGGLRGAVSAALILLIPHTYPYRDYFLCMAFFLIAFSLIVQPIAMQGYLKRAKL